MTPASRMLSAITQANTGRSMKNRGVIASRRGLRVRRLLRLSGLLAPDGHFLSSTDLLEAVNYDTFPGLESTEHSPRVLVQRTHPDRALLDHVAGPDHHDVGAVCRQCDGPL